jgi:hypothetical protein
LITNIGDINAYFAQFQGFFSEAAAALISGATAANKRGDLLWWKQALYSNTLNNSYRTLTPIAAAIAMLADLADLVGLMYPESVNYLLVEGLRDVHSGFVESKDTLTGWLTKALESGEILKPLLTPLKNEGPGRKSLGAAFANALATGDVSHVSEETGIDSSQELALAELAVWLFHDLQAMKFAVQK